MKTVLSLAVLLTLVLSAQAFPETRLEHLRSVIVTRHGELLARTFSNPKADELATLVEQDLAEARDALTAPTDSSVGEALGHLAVALNSLARAVKMEKDAALATWAGQAGSELWQAASALFREAGPGKATPAETVAKKLVALDKKAGKGGYGKAVAGLVKLWPLLDPKPIP